MTATDPTGILASEWSYGFPNGEPEEGKPGPLPRRTPGATVSPATTLRFSHPEPSAVLTPGEQRRWSYSGHVIEIVGVHTEGPFAGQYEYRHVDTGDTGIHSAANILEWTEPATPTDTPTGAVTTPSPVPVGGALPSLVELDQREALGDLLSSVDDLLANGMDQGYYHDNVREALTAYRKAVSS